MPMKPAKADRLIRASIHSMSYPMKNPGSRGRARGFSVERRLTLYQSMRKAPVRSMGRRSRPQSQPGLSPCLTGWPGIETQPSKIVAADSHQLGPKPLLQRVLEKIDTLCAQRDQLKKELPGPTAGKVMGSLARGEPVKWYNPNARDSPPFLDALAEVRRIAFADH